MANINTSAAIFNAISQAQAALDAANTAVADDKLKAALTALAAAQRAIASANTNAAKSVTT